MRPSASLASAGWMPSVGYAPVCTLASVSDLISSILRSAVCADTAPLTRHMDAANRIDANARMAFLLF
jgi:hypothetical protein